MVAELAEATVAPAGTGKLTEPVEKAD